MGFPALVLLLVTVDTQLFRYKEKYGSQVKYIVVRNGEEKMTFATKGSRRLYKCFDIADNCLNS